MNAYLKRMVLRVKAIRGLMGWTQGRLADEIGYSRQTVQALEKTLHGGASASNSQSIIMAIFTAVSADVEEKVRKSEVIHHHFKDWDNVEKRPEIIKEVKDYIGVENNILSVITSYLSSKIDWGSGYSEGNNKMFIKALEDTGELLLLFNGSDREITNSKHSGKEISNMIESVVFEWKHLIADQFEMYELNAREFVRSIKEEA